MSGAGDDWPEAGQPARPAAPVDQSASDVLVVDVGGFEGPLDLLLSLAREQKVDLTRISILALAEQYLTFIDAARRLSLEVAADYLVMAAWLAYLKSRLLLPEKEAEEEPSGVELAAVLALRLRRLEAMRQAGNLLMERSRLGQHVFARGAPEVFGARKSVTFDASLYDLLEAYSALRMRKLVRTVRVARREVLTLREARERLTRLIGATSAWAPVDSFLADYLARPELRATARASALSASLEMVREGQIELRQIAPFAPLYIRRKTMPESARGGDLG